MATGESQSVQVAGRTLTVSSLDKVLYPETGTTKGEVLNYYVRVADRLLPRLAGRPVTRIRWPHGVAGVNFFEKNVPSGVPDWLPRVTITGHGSRSGTATVTYPLVEDLAGLVYLVNLGSLELHVPQWRVDDDGVPQPPDRLVIDLDPGPGAGLGECARVALLVKERLAGAGLECEPVTSGSKGLHLYAGLDGVRSSEEVTTVTKALAQQLTQEHPDLVLWQMTKAKRGGKVFLDWSQNNAAKTTICPYSMRGRQHPTAAAPRSWDEIESAAQGHQSLTQVPFDEMP